MKLHYRLYSSVWITLFLMSFSNAQDVFITAGTTISSSGAAIINFGSGTVTNNGVIANSDGTLIFSGPGAFSGAGTTHTKNLTVAHSGTSVLNNTIEVTGSLLVSSGTLNANDRLTLVSNAAGSAVVAPVGYVTYSFF